jgi:hypothetical protein
MHSGASRRPSDPHSPAPSHLSEPPLPCRPIWPTALRCRWWPQPAWALRTRAWRPSCHCWPATTARAGRARLRWTTAPRWGAAGQLHGSCMAAARLLHGRCTAAAQLARPEAATCKSWSSVCCCLGFEVGCMLRWCIMRWSSWHACRVTSGVEHAMHMYRDSCCVEGPYQEAAA